MRSRLTTVLTVLAALATCGVAAAGAPARAATSPRAGYSALTLEGAAGSYLLASGAKELVGTDVTVRASRGSLTFTGSPDPSYAATLADPTDSPMSVGTYTLARQPAAAVVGLDVVADGSGCSRAPGSLVVHHLARNAQTGVIRSLSATYSISCDGSSTTVGELRYNSTDDYERFGAGPLGISTTPRTVTVTAESDTTFGTAVLEGTDPTSFVLGPDSCSGATVLAGQTCSVSVLAHPLHESGLAAALRLPSASGDDVVGLTTVGVDTPAGAYTAVAANRVLDTRRRIGVPGTSPLGSGGQIDVQVGGTRGIPAAGVASVVLNVTVVSPTAPGYVTVSPSGVARPLTSTVNFAAGWTGADLVTVGVGTSGKVHLYNFAGSTHLVADVVGYYHSSTSTADQDTAPWNDFHSISPHRAVDTRTPEWGNRPLESKHFLWQALDFGGDLNSRIRAFAVNVTVTRPTGSGYLVTFDGDSDVWPTSSTLNFTAGRTVPNMTIVRTGTCYAECGSSGGLPRLAVGNASTGPVHVVVDVVGIYFIGQEGDRGWRYTSLPSPRRYVDSRIHLGLSSTLSTNSSQAVAAPETVAGHNTMAVVSNVTAARPSDATVLTLFRNDTTTPPVASNLNPYAGQVVSNMAITDVWTANDFRVWNLLGSTPVVIDASGTMEHYPLLVPPAAASTTGPASERVSAARGGDAGSRTVPSPRPAGRGVAAASR